MPTLQYIPEEPINIRAWVTQPFYAALGIKDRSTGDLLDFTAADLRLQQRRTTGAASIVLDLSFANGGLVLLDPEVVVGCNLAFNITEALLTSVPIGNWPYALRYWHGPNLMVGNWEWVGSPAR